MERLEKRLGDVMRNMPPQFFGEVMKYWKSNNKILLSINSLGAHLKTIPYWITLPGLLINDQKPQYRIKYRVFLEDITWAQYCLYFAIRVKDDIMDGQLKNLSFLFASDCFIAEADRIFRKYFRDESLFWNIERECFFRTICGIVEADELQKKIATNRKKLLSAYADISSIFKIGTAAVCVRLNIPDVYQQISKFEDHIAIASQIIDDLQDIDEDRRRGRFNYVAQLLLGSSGNRYKKSRIQKIILTKLFSGDGIGKVSREVYGHLESAAKCILPLEISGMDAHIKHFKKCYKRIEERLLKQRFKLLFDQVRTT